MDFASLTQGELYSDDVINYIFDEEDPVSREQMKFALLDRAAEFGPRIEKRVESLLKIAESDYKKRMKKSNTTDTFNRMTDFGDEITPMQCGGWIADMTGIYNPNAPAIDRTVCCHPIYIDEIITNIEEGTQKVKLAYNRGRGWRYHTVSKNVIANKSKITELSVVDIHVNSENAKGLVKYLSDIENLNRDDIPEVRATAKMGWCEDGFMPYNSELAFDRDGRFDRLFDSITTEGSRKKWFEHVLAIRAQKRTEPRAVMAASFASVILKPCGLLPFWFNLWGTTGGGKSVCGMLAASIWADPEIGGQYISQAEGTVVSFEQKAGFLNHLPFVMDDTAKVREKLKDNFSELIYRLAAGEGKSRSNTMLGIAPKAQWKNVIICSGETPLITDRMQGGAINRLLEYPMDEGEIFEDGKTTAALLCDNYGFAGKELVDILSNMGFEKVSELQDKIYRELQLKYSDKYENKQLLSLSALLTADRIATDELFKDGIYLSSEELEKCLTDKKSMSENERCYDFIINECNINANKLIPNGFGEYQGEIWGKYITNDENKKVYVAITCNVLNKLCASGGFSAKAFIQWADRKGLLWKGNNGTPSRQVSIVKELKPKCYVILDPTDDEEDENQDQAGNQITK